MYKINVYQIYNVAISNKLHQRKYNSNFYFKIYARVNQL